ncbi:MAG: fructose-bisphosphatase, class II [candidate division NC10 bacterium RIFCSPLOWO2_12_FULL_66_18]|nr:MAG: fructose-bisphosphatase, class II [candidate division NC10 bacterium RIFCSPLOWO2_02_FULL_66_22]OGC00592.1 MAG: fructose-bisphosphatase, class II [candidate division NC10 bacterium RIFCSPLOWO2_12_FULL_66_18]
MERNLALEVVRVTEAAALSSARWMGVGNEKAADQSAVDAMRRAFEAVPFCGTVVIGEGERDEAPMLFIGERIGSGDGPELDVALDPLEGTTIVAQGRANAMSVVAITETGGFLHAPDTTMDKIAVGPKAKGAVDLSLSPEQNLRNIADAMKCYVEDLTVVILDRPRHTELIRAVREVGARIKLIQDGDVSAAIATGFPETGVDVLMGIGGAPEGVLAAAALQCLGGDMQGRLKARNDHEVERARRMGIKDIDRIYRIGDLAKGNDIMFAATGVTDGDLLRGVRFFGGGARTHSVAMRYRSGTVRFIEATHRFDRKPVY